MIVTQSIDEVRSCVAQAKAAGKSVGFVPTMGALHAGHRSLIEAARESCDFVAVSIFVNPTQFGADEDLSGYPKTLQADLSACEQAGVDLVFTPTEQIMYPAGALTEVSVGELADKLCGERRPGHFAGVCTIVAKLFNITRADKAFFGAKDFQQAVVIKQMVCDLNFPVEIVVCPTVREADGLAMSSRNAYLSESQRRQAPSLNAALQSVASTIRTGHPPAEQIVAAITSQIASQVPDGEIDYVKLVDPKTLCDAPSTDMPVLIALAVRIGPARLIDNTLVD